MGKYPVVLCSSVIRSSTEGESHGGLYLVDLDNERVKQVVDWEEQNIDWSGRGAERGLRGIEFYNDQIIAATSDEICYYDKEFNLIKSFTNEYLKYCHEIHRADDRLYLSSTGTDSILIFNLKTDKFEKGACIRVKINVLRMLDKIPNKLGIKWGINYGIIYFSFDPESDDGPSTMDTHHINNVFYKDGEIYFSGTGMTQLMKINKNDEVENVAWIPIGTHNVQFYNGYILFNQTADDNVSLCNRKGHLIQSFRIKTYDEDELINTNVPKDHARQGFGRGLCTYGDYIIGGSSPATISLYKIGETEPIKTVNISMDIRNAIHGLEVYPYECGHLF